MPVEEAQGVVEKEVEDGSWVQAEPERLSASLEREPQGLLEKMAQEAPQVRREKPHPAESAQLNEETLQKG